MSRKAIGEMKLAELAERSGIPERTIRLYIARGLLQGPLRAGRKAAYGPQHLETLHTIKRLQKEGMTLSQIRRRLGHTEGEAGLPPPTSWWNYPVAPDVTVWVRAETNPWRLRQIGNALKTMRDLLDDAAEPQEQEEEE